MVIEETGKHSPLEYLFRHLPFQTTQVCSKAESESRSKCGAFSKQLLFCIHRPFYLLLGDVSSPPLRVRNRARRLLRYFHQEHTREKGGSVRTRIVPRATVQSGRFVFHAIVLHGWCWSSHVLGSWSVLLPHHATCLYLRHRGPPSTI